MGWVMKIIISAFIFLSCWPALAHDLHHSVSRGEAVVIQLYFADGREFSFQSYEIYPEGGKVPDQVGRTDYQGRIVFIPDHAGTWRIKAFSEDGHGLDISLETDGQNALLEVAKPLFDRYSRIFVGLAVILGFFGVLMLFTRRRKA